MIRSIPLIFIIFSIILCTSCTNDSLPEKRAQRAENAKGNIVIGCVETSTSPSLLKEGVSMAVDQINANGGILGRKISIIFKDDDGDQYKAQKIAQALANDQDVIAVIGHRLSNVAIPVSITYEKYGILFLSTGATNPGLTRYSKNFTFRNIPTDIETGQEIANYIFKKGYKNIAVFYQRDFEGKRLAEIFQETAQNRGIQIVSRRSYYESQKEFKNDLWIVKKNFNFDAIFIAGNLPASAWLIKQTREMGIDAPIFGGSGLDSPMLITEASKTAEGTFVTSTFNPNSMDKKSRDFVKTFEETYGFLPDIWAAQGYDAISVIAHIIDITNSTVPIVLSSKLRFLENWEGVTGSYGFTRQGDISGKRIFFKQLLNRQFVYLETEEEGRADPFNYNDNTTLRLPLEVSMPSIDPGLVFETTSTEIIEQLFLALTDFDPADYSAVPELAESWSVKDNGKVYRFNLRKDAKWTNGESVTAHDVVWTIQRNIHPGTDAPNAQMLYIIKNAQAINEGKIKNLSDIGVKALNDFEVEFTLDYPAVYFPSLVSMPVFRPLPQKAIEANGNKWTEPENIVTNGSYKLVLWNKDLIMVLKKNPLYYEANKVLIPEVRFFNIHNSSLGHAMYINNELDIIGSSYLRLPFMEIPNILQDPVLKKEFHQEPIFCTYAYAFNTKRPPVDNILVRKAIASAIDRQLLVDIITKGGEEVATTYARPPIFGSVDPIEGIGMHYDPLQAKQWLAEAGYPEGKNFPDMVLRYNTSETHKKIAEAIKASLKYNLNINIRLEEEDFKKFIDTMTSPNPPHMFRLGWCSDYPDIHNWVNDQFHPRHPMIQTGLDSIEFAEILDRTEQETNPDERKRLFKKAERILCEEKVAIIPLYYETANCLVKPRIKGWYHMALGGQHIRDWYFEEK